ncbi:Uncharacterised protein [Slackia heliotrinireducens]|uniref:Uncharacterized protein n=1 Tax=Slackia heliotrinireducens (strain ATCC 29202 / DSM 20476 / NCTC 11029 / RHS 1) TaxID=471855 RepID=C7N287_SLAHD|nr:hypothetical protein [Slackia heliotrinireducens]ACV21393.1 hypothetical protein Shel_03260 [Slackia heliotrinireducens DSM 20476]VEG98826.1 Uncharacterised protein [Slackia heliotrinireducens]
MSNTEWRYASYDIDNPNGADYCASTDFKSDGSVHRYDAVRGDFGKGHGHNGYGSTDDYLAGNKKDWSRSVNDPDSQNRPWNNPY